MTADRPSKAALALKIAGAAAVIGASKALFRASPRIVARDGSGEAAADDGAHSRRSDLITYGVGYLLALALTCIAFALVHWRWASGATTLGIVFALALVQAIVHFRCFLHVDLKRSARDDLQLILFSTLIIALMVGGTLVVLLNLRTRMM
ncbi:cytochrome o ubiquinol/quinol oxidase subunit IV [Methylobacterium sp. J-090]|uniref:cytochrome o ubiquinol oxidase subunit IV n=1 Tax=Methylobacterium sp. J-090 TaxID=2836666 RepID=UPI001FBAC358|nr:cytochrome C oxidase subunit IV family protein [Methylobacterium sp. J-090]MCJ2080314.1 cytochrome C oxidase subunit IV family protein [Methylobacterium sp. J-090]